MSLAGIHRDSIQDLLSLVPPDEKDGEESVSSIVETDCSFSDIPLENSKDEFLILEDNDVDEKVTEASSSPNISIDDVSPSGPPSGPAVPPTEQPGSHEYDDYWDSPYDPYAPSSFVQDENDFNCLSLFCLPKRSRRTKNKKISAETESVDSTIETSRLNRESDASMSKNFSPEKRKEQHVDDQRNLLGVGSVANGDNQKDEGKSVELRTTQGDFSSDGMRSKIETVDLRAINATETSDRAKLPKGILKKAGMAPKKTNNARRPLFKDIRYESSYEGQAKEIELKVKFAPMAKVITVAGRQHLPFSIRKDIWWSRKDYDDFKKTGRMISKAMSEGGSEIWLGSQYQHKSNKGADEEENYGEKWWCKFGHSRRGLEHIASIDEGKYRHQNVMNSIKATLDEQTRQRIYGIEDPKRLGTAASKYTSFARDLALAAGTVDAEAVRSNFCSRVAARPHYMKVHEKPSNPLLDKNFLDIDSDRRSLHRRRNSSEVATVKIEVMTRELSSTSSETSEKAKSLKIEAAGYGKDEEKQVDRLMVTGIGITVS